MSVKVALNNPFSPYLERRGQRKYQLNAEHEELGFTVKIARNDNQLFSALAVRKESYTKHHPDYAEIVAVKDRRDQQSGSIVFVAESKLDGSPLGTVRIETNQMRPLQMESDFKLPKSMQGTRLAHISRMATRQGTGGRSVKYGLLKAVYLYCHAKEVKFFLIATIPPLERLYYRLGFTNLSEKTNSIQLSEYGNFPMRVLRAKVSRFEYLTSKFAPDLNRFMFHSIHADIKIFESVSSQWEVPRKT